jgi:hypothetical protein
MGLDETEKEDDAEDIGKGRLQGQDQPGTAAHAEMLRHGDDDGG